MKKNIKSGSQRRNELALAYGRKHNKLGLGPPQYGTAPASGDLNDHPEASAWRSLTDTAHVVLHPYSKFQVCMLVRSEDFQLRR